MDIVCFLPKTTKSLLLSVALFHAYDVCGVIWEQHLFSMLDSPFIATLEVNYPEGLGLR